ncbi:helix-turn-helix domain-containing protein, partial [Actinoplanes sp. NPDC051411]|uniref:AraC family transcriptional regulator n=1 Tax=Actinoplanes sp. NPDC051411 TaxID=3155522 RepID=UPI0034383F68
ITNALVPPPHVLRPNWLARAPPPAPAYPVGGAPRGPFTVGYAAFGTAAPLPHRLLPLNIPTVIVDFDTGAALLTGPRARASVDGPTSWGRGVSIGLTPHGATLLAGLPLSELSGQTVELDLPLAAPLAALPSWPARFAWLDAAFSRPLSGPSFAASTDPRWSPSPAVTAAWWRLQRTSRVSDVAAALGLTRRRLERDFRREIGLSPGAVARTARLQRSLTAMLRGAPPTEAATTGGFADQPHLTRTMRDLVGLTPAAFRAFVQDITPSTPQTSGA